MKRISIPLLTLIIALTAIQARPEDFTHGRFGLGLVLGKPTGICAKYWLAPRSALDATVGWDFASSWLEIQAGYLYHFPIKGVPNGSLAAYAGGGGDMLAYASVDNEPGGVVFAARIPVGLEYIYKPISFYAEVDPLVIVYPNPAFAFGGGIGFRFYF